ncbi:hypothetical protein TNCV_4144571 [Trichonephila clavipes]|nr:hypothetical protein TNCV_4144571 [Trichonephila clavipes]
MDLIKKTPTTKRGGRTYPQSSKRSIEEECRRGEGKNAGRKAGRPKAVNQDDVFPFSAPIGIGSFELLSLKRSHPFRHIPAQAPRAPMSGYTLCFKTRCRHRIGSKQNTLLMRLL